MEPFSRAADLFRRCRDERTDESDLEAVAAWPLDRVSVLFSAMDMVRRHFFGNRVMPCAIMNIKSGACSEDCAFCSQSRRNSARVPRTPLSNRDDIIAAYRKARSRGLHFGVVSSGNRLPSREVERLAGALAQCTGPKHASLGMLAGEEMRLLRGCGVVCYNHNLETSRSFFPRIVSTHTYDQRIETIRRARSAGMSICCGGIFGMGESWSDRIELCMTLRGLAVETVPVNFLNPVPGIRLPPPGERVLEFLKIISLVRVALPRAAVKVCGGRELHLHRHQNLMFWAGANGYISGDYLTTAGAPVESDDRMIRDMGLEKESIDDIV